MATMLGFIESSNGLDPRQVAMTSATIASESSDSVQSLGG